MNKLFGHKSQKFVVFCLIAAVAILTGCSSELSAPSADKIVDIADKNAIDINTATHDELQRIPYVGEVMADRIISFREANGGFDRAEQLMLVQGMSDKRFRSIRHLIRVSDPKK